MESLYPAAHFPTSDEQVHYDIEGSLLPDTAEPGVPVPKDVQSGVPEVTPASASSQPISVSVPIAPPCTPSEAAVMQTSTNVQITSTPGSESSNSASGASGQQGISSITSS